MDDVVSVVYEFHIEGSAGTYGSIRLRPLTATLVTEPVKFATKGAAAEDSAADSCLGSSKIKSLISSR